MAASNPYIPVSVLATGLIFPLTVSTSLGVVVPIPTLPDPLTNKILEEAGESILNKLADDAPEM